MTEPLVWKRLCALAVDLCQGQAGFRTQANILKRLVKQYGAIEVERMIEGAKLLGWQDLKSLGSAEGLGRRMAIGRFWQHENKHPAKMPEKLKGILWRMANQ